LFFKIVSIVSIVFKTFAAKMVGGSGDGPNLLSCVVLKTIETIETIFFVEKTTFVVEKFQILSLKSSLFVVPSPQFYLKSRLSFCQF